MRKDGDLDQGGSAGGGKSTYRVYFENRVNRFHDSFYQEYERKDRIKANSRVSDLNNWKETVCLRKTAFGIWMESEDCFNMLILR